VGFVVGVDIDGKGGAHDGVGVAGAGDEIGAVDDVAAADAPAVADADLFGRRGNLDTVPRAAEGAQAADDAVELGAGVEGGGGELGGVEGEDAVFVVHHREEEIVADGEQRGHHVGRRDAAADDLGAEGALGGGRVGALFAMDVAREGGVVFDDEEGAHRERLARALFGFAGFPFATGESAEVTVARGVDEDGGAPRLAAGFRLGDDGGEAPALAVGGDDVGVELIFTPAARQSSSRRTFISSGW
jgi:hypothetical protein